MTALLVGGLTWTAGPAASAAPAAVLRPVAPAAVAAPAGYVMVSTHEIAATEVLGVDLLAGRVSAVGIGLDIAPGETVIFAKYSGTEIRLDGEDYLQLSGNEILAVVG
nr:molecular chaperone [Kitasatospora sp. SID7827]